MNLVIYAENETNQHFLVKSYNERFVDVFISEKLTIRNNKILAF